MASLPAFAQAPTGNAYNIEVVVFRAVTALALVVAALDYQRAQKKLSENHRPPSEEQSRWRLAGRYALLNSRS